MFNYYGKLVCAPCDLRRRKAILENIAAVNKMRFELHEELKDVREYKGKKALANPELKNKIRVIRLED